MRALLLMLCLLAMPAAAVVETFEFSDEGQRVRYLRFVDELRCPKCQNQNLAGSNAPIAQDLRQELYRLLTEGKSDAEIVEFMVSRYGDYVLYRPPLQSTTVLLWGAPALLLIMALVFAWRAQRRRHPGDKPTSALSTDEQQRLQTLLDTTSRETER